MSKVKVTKELNEIAHFNSKNWYYLVMPSDAETVLLLGVKGLEWWCDENKKFLPCPCNDALYQDETYRWPRRNK